VNAVVEIEAITPGVPLYHVSGYRGRAYLYVYRAAGGALRPVIDVDWLLLGRGRDRVGRRWPPLDGLIAAAFPDLASPGARPR